MLRGIPDSRSVKFPPHLEQPATPYLWVLLIAGLPCTTRSLHFCGFCQIMLKPEYLFHCVKAGREESERAEDGIVGGSCTWSDWKLHRSCDGHAVAWRHYKNEWETVKQTDRDCKQILGERKWGHGKPAGSQGNVRDRRWTCGTDMGGKEKCFWKDRGCAVNEGR